MLLVTFDLTSLFPSVLVDVRLKYFEHILVINKIDKINNQEYIQLTLLCMFQNYF